MTDRKLLEAAAKAAGIELRYWAESQESFNLALTEPRRWWNPLADDGDALRLAVRLNMAVVVFPDAVGIGIKGPFGYREYGIEADPYAATRRAIVRAAASIGGSNE